MSELDRDFLRFLWVSNISDIDPDIVIKRFTSLLFGLICSPFLFWMAVFVHMSQFTDNDRKVMEAFLRDLYMDDSISGAQTFEEAFNMYMKCKKLMKLGGFP